MTGTDLVRTSVRPPSPVRGRIAMLVALLVAIIGSAALALVADVGGEARAQSAVENELVSSDPEDGSTVAVSPERLTFTFAEQLGPDDVLTAPVACATVSQRTGIPDVASDRTTVTVEVLTPFPRGACTVPWLLRDSLGETITSGLITFSVQADTVGADDDESPATTAAPTPAPTPQTPAADSTDEGSAGGALWLGRVLSTTAVLALFGALVLIGMTWPEGPEYVITARFLRAVWLVALVGTVLFVASATAQVSGRSFGAALGPNTWTDLLDAGWTGRAAVARLVLVLVTGWVVIRPERIIDPTTQLPAYALPALAVVMVGVSRTGGDLAIVGVGLSVAHAFGTAVWFGGALMVARVVVAGPGDDDLVQAVRGFNRLSIPAMLVTLGTGVAQLLRLSGGALFTSGHGRVLVLKAVVVAAMLFVAITTRQMVNARLRRADELTTPTADRFRRAYTAEAGIGVVVLALSGWLLALQPAGIDDRITYPVERLFNDDTSGLEVIVSITPARVGPNGLRVEVETPPEGISNLVVTLLPPEDVPARGIEQTIPLSGAGTAVLEAVDGVPLDVPGTWTMQLSGVTTQGTLTAATSSFTVGGEAAEPTPTAPGATQPPSGDDPAGDDPTERPVVTIEIGD